jgi:hypothetical protein
VRLFLPYSPLAIGIAAFCVVLGVWSVLAADEQDELTVGLQPDGRILVPTNQILKTAPMTRSSATRCTANGT